MSFAMVVAEPRVMSTNWSELIHAAMSTSPISVMAEMDRGIRWETSAKPAVLGCSDGNDYVVKGSQTGKVVVNEQVVARLGHMLDAPIPPVQLIGVTTDLHSICSHLRYIQAGYAHGSRLINDCSDKRWLSKENDAENGPRIAALAVLYGWMQAGDPQLIYSLAKPKLVWSVDHGHFFPNGPEWTISDLRGAGPATVFADLLSACDRSEVHAVMERLSTINSEAIAGVVAVPPTGWKFSMEERIELAVFLDSRRSDLLDWKS